MEWEIKWEHKQKRNEKKLVFATVVICLSFIHLITVKHLYFQHRSLRLIAHWPLSKMDCGNGNDENNNNKKSV